MQENKILSLIPVLSSVFIFGGAYKLIIYYRAFGINILDFLEISEIMTSFMDDLVLVVVVMLITLLLLFLSYRKEMKDSSELLSKALDKKQFFKRLKLYLRSLKIMLLFYGGFVLGAGVLFFLEKLTIRSFLMDFCYMTGLIVFTIIAYEVQVKYNSLFGRSIKLSYYRISAPIALIKCLIVPR